MQAILVTMAGVQPAQITLLKRKGIPVTIARDSVTADTPGKAHVSSANLNEDHVAKITINTAGANFIQTTELGRRKGYRIFVNDRLLSYDPCPLRDEDMISAEQLLDGKAYFQYVRKILLARN